MLNDRELVSARSRAVMPKHAPKTDTALGELCCRWSQPLRRQLRSTRVVRPCDIDDIAQETFLRLLRYSSGIEIHDPLGYLYRVACNIANEWHDRAVNRMPHVSDEALEELGLDVGESPEGVIDREKRDRMVRAAIACLPQRVRRVTELRAYDDLTYSQIAKRLGITYRKVMRDLVRARSELRTQFHTDDHSARTCVPAAAKAHLRRPAGRCAAAR